MAGGSRGGAMSKSRSTPSLGGKTKSGGKAQAASVKPGKDAGGKLAWAEAEIHRAQKALLATSEQMRQEAHGFMLASVINASKQTKPVEVDEAIRDKTRSKPGGVNIPDDFFLALCQEVETHIDRDKSPRSLPDQSLRPTPMSNKKLGASGRTVTLGSPDEFDMAPTPSAASQRMGQNVDIKDFTRQTSAEMDSTVRMSPRQSPRMQKAESMGAQMTDTGTSDAFGRARSETAMSRRSRLDTTASERADPFRQGQDVKAEDLDKFFEHGSKLMSALGTPMGNAEESLRDGRNLLSSSVGDLLEDLKSAAEVSRFETESLAPTATIADDDDEVPFWERHVKTAEEDEKYEIDQAIWRFRKYLRNRFGSAQKAWAALEGARKTVDGAVDDIDDTRMADTLSLAEIKIALSRLGIKLPFVTGYDKVKQLLASIDRNNTRYLTYTELMGDEEKDRSLLADPPPAAKETWQTDLRQPRWIMNWEVGYFDKDMLECIISRDYFRPTREMFKTSTTKTAEGYKPVWQKYQQVLDERRGRREELMAQKKDNELDGCTFKPDMEYSKKTAKRILWAKKMRRALSQPIKSVHESNLEKMMSLQKETERECTFHPSLCSRSKLIYSNILDSGKPWWARLSETEKHDRMNHTAFMTKEAQDAMTGKPDIHETANYGIHHERRGQIHERLFHHEKHEFWHGDERGVPPELEKRMSIMPAWAGAAAGATPGEGSLQSSPVMQKLARKESAQATPVDMKSNEGDAGPAGEVTVEYRQQLLGLMEACERWGTRVDDDRWATSASASRAKFAASPSTQDASTPGMSSPGRERGISSASNTPARQGVERKAKAGRKANIAPSSKSGKVQSGRSTR